MVSSWVVDIVNSLRATEECSELCALRAECGAWLEKQLESAHCPEVSTGQCGRGRFLGADSGAVVRCEGEVGTRFGRSTVDWQSHLPVVLDASLGPVEMEGGSDAPARIK